MIQNIIVYVIIAAVVVYAVYAVVKSLKKKDASGCGDCNGCDIKNELTKNLPNQTHKDPANCGCK